MKFFFLIHRWGLALYNEYTFSYKPITIPNVTMSGDELSVLLQKRARDKKILEFGSGGSTILFAQIGRHVTSIESDKNFRNQVANRLTTLKLTETATVYWANIGPVKSYGQPLRFLRFLYGRRYSSYYLDVFSVLKI